MSCIRIPLSLDDAQAIIECAGGLGWREPFVLGLATVVVLGLLVVGTFLALRVAVR